MLSAHENRGTRHGVFCENPCGLTGNIGQDSSKVQSLVLYSNVFPKPGKTFNCLNSFFYHIVSSNRPAR